MRLLSLIACAALASSSAAQTTWYVDAHAAGPGSGTSTDPYASIQYAHDRPTTLAYDVVLVAAGEYGERLHITKNITIRSTSGPLATILRPTLAGDSVDLDGDFSDYLAACLEGFTIFKVGNNDYTAAVRGNNGKIRHCIVIGNGTGFGTLSDYDLGVEHCTVVGHRIGVTEAPYFGLLYVVSTISCSSTEHDVQYINSVGPNYSCYGNGLVYGGTGNIEADPQLFDVAGHDFHLLASSPCIDSGTPTLPGDPFGPFDEIGALAFDTNYAPFSVYCTAKTNSLGCVPAIGANGTPSASSGLPFVITCADELNDKLGLFFYGSAPMASAYQGGWLCVQSPVHRTPVISSGGNVGVGDCSGVFSYDFNALVRSGGDPALVPNAEVFGQFWSRDPSASFTTNRSDAVRFRIEP